MLKTYIKILEMKILSLIAWIWEKIQKKNISPADLKPKKIAILFLKNLGIGDLIMLSPAIQKISEIFPNSKIYLITWVEPIFDFPNIEWILPKNFQKKQTQKMDLIISPTMCFRHWKYIFSAKAWLGFFSSNKIQTNLKAEKLKYNIQNEHYLWRGIDIIKAINKVIGEEIALQTRERTLEYPELLSHKPEYFNQELIGKKYLAVAPISKSQDRQWPIQNFVKICEYCFETQKIEKIAFLGDKSKWDNDFINQLIKKLKRKAPKDSLISLAGKNTLQETCYIIKNSELFIGLDSSPAHFAYFLAKKAIAIFINVNPLFRLPLTSNKNKIITLKPDDPDYACYTGLNKGNIKKCLELTKTITTEKAQKAIDELYKN